MATAARIADTKKPLKDRASSFLNERWNELKNAYIIYHMSVWEALLFYAGQSWIAWDENRKIWYPNTPTDEWVPRPRINRFSPTIDTVCTNFNNVPEVEAVPKTDLNGDLRIHGIAEIASALGDHFTINNGLRGDFKQQEDKTGLAAQLFVLAGAVFTNVYPEVDKEYDVPLNEPVPTFSIRCPVCDLYEETDNPPHACPNCAGPLQTEQIQRMSQRVDPNTGQPMTQKERRYKICCEVGNPIYGFPRPGAQSMADTPYFVWSQRKTLDWIWYNLNYEAEADYEFADGYSVTFEHALQYYYTGFAASTIQAKDSALVKWLYIEPNKVRDFPEGAYAVMVNGEIAESGAWKDKFVEHPLTYGGYLQIPTLFANRSIAFDLVEIQREKQSYDALIKLHAMTSAVDSIIVDENTVVSEITGRADKIIKWRSIGPGSQAPHRMQHGTLDEGVYKMKMSLEGEFENISGAVAVYRGRQPGSITAGKAIEDLKGQAEQMFSKPVLNWQALWRETIRKGVRNIQKFYTHEQIAEIVGADRTTQIDDFRKCDMDAILDWIASKSGEPRSRAERKQEMFQLFDRGALDVSDPNVKQQVYELFGDTGLMKMFNADATRARYENKQMMGGQPVRVMAEIEDLAVHYSIHVERIKSLEFERWPDPAKQLMLQHAMETKQAMMGAQIQAAAIGAPAGPKPPPGKPGGGPPPPKPELSGGKP
jgi:hypothetical protein